MLYVYNEQIPRGQVRGYGVGERLFILFFGPGFSFEKQRAVCVLCACRERALRVL
jgi:hypothetical protein